MLFCLQGTLGWSAWVSRLKKKTILQVENFNVAYLFSGSYLFNKLMVSQGKVETSC